MKKVDIITKIIALANIGIALLVALEVINFNFIWVTIVITLFLVCIPKK